MWTMTSQAIQLPNGSNWIVSFINSVNFEQKLIAKLDSPCESFERVAIENAQTLPSKHLL